MAGRWPLSRTQQQDINGTPLIGAQAFFYEAATSTPLTVHSDYGLTTEHTWPVVADGNGRFPLVFIRDGFYSVTVKTSAGVIVFSDPTDVVVGESTGGSSGTVFDPNALNFTGVCVWTPIRSGAVTGWLECNGETIGSASSGANGYANSAAQTLFETIWAAGDNTIFPLYAAGVATARGASAAADWAANRAIALPDMRHRGPMGTGTMGATAAGRLSTATLTVGSVNQVGSSGGAETITLTTAHLAAHTHSFSATSGAGTSHTHSFSATSGASGAHDHTFTTTSGAGGDHTHGGATGSNGGHQHVLDGASNAAAGAQRFTLDGTGETKTTDTVSNHTHSISASGTHTHSVGGTTDSVTTHTHSVSGTSGAESAHTHSVSGTSGSTGSGTAHNNMGPYMLGTWYIKL